MRKAEVFFFGRKAGEVVENAEKDYEFTYDLEYLKLPDAAPISLTLPLQAEKFWHERLFSFFDGLIPEGWLLDIAEDTWKLDHRDRFGLLLVCCKSCIGAVSIKEVPNE